MRAGKASLEGPLGDKLAELRRRQNAAAARDQSHFADAPDSSRPNTHQSKESSSRAADDDDDDVSASRAFGRIPYRRRMSTSSKSHQECRQFLHYCIILFGLLTPATFRSIQSMSSAASFRRCSA